MGRFHRSGQALVVNKACFSVANYSLSLYNRSDDESFPDNDVSIRHVISGVLYAGMMLTPSGPKTLEFNCRFGDPETQVILPLLESDLFDVMEACCDDRLEGVELKFRQDVHAVGIVMASKGYPETSTKGCVIKGRFELIALDYRSTGLKKYCNTRLNIESS